MIPKISYYFLLAIAISAYSCKTILSSEKLTLSPTKSTSVVDISSPGIGKKIDEHLQLLQTKGFLGGVIVAVQDEKILQGGYGFADRKNKVRYTPRTVSALA